MGVQVIARAADVLRALEVEPGGLSLAKIAQRVESPRSKPSRWWPRPRLAAATV